MSKKNILITVSMNKNIIEQLPCVFVKDEEELQAISSELGRFLEGNVHRLSNGLIIITSED